MFSINGVFGHKGEARPFDW